jgi:ankyrin repeat protein
MGKLIDAVSAGKLPEVQKLLAGEYRNGPLINTEKDPQGRHPLYLASKRGLAEIAQALLKAGAKVDQPNQEKQTSLYAAAAQGKVNVIKILLEGKAQIDQSDKDGATSLWIAAQKGQADEAMQVLIKAGAKVDQADKDEATPLFIATSENNIEAIQTLLKAKAKVDQPDNDKTTPLIIATSENKVKIKWKLSKYYWMPELKSINLKAMAVHLSLLLSNKKVWRPSI